MRCAAQPSLERHEHARATHESARRKGAAEGVAVRRPLAALLRAILSPGLPVWSPGEHCLLPLFTSVGVVAPRVVSEWKQLAPSKDARRRFRAN